MTRLPTPERDALPAEAQQAWDMIAGARGSVRGPFAMLIHHPALAQGVAALGEYLRFNGTLSGAERELAILAAGREVEAPYEWVAHEPIARREGTRPEAIEVVRAATATDDLAPRERLIIECVRSLYRSHTLSDDLYAAAEAEFGRQPLIELVTLAGYYGMIAFVLNAFAVDLPTGAVPPF